MSELSVILIICLALLLIYILYKVLDKRGLYFAIIILNIITFIFCFKISTIFKMNINTGILTMIEINSIIYIFLFKYNIKEIKNILKLSLIANITTALLIFLMTKYIPVITETISISMQSTFEYNFKILIIYPIIMAISQYITAKFYSLITILHENMIMGVCLTYIITAVLYTIIFLILSYLKIFELKDSLFIGVSTYIFGIAITILNIPYMYYIFYKKVKK